MTNNIAEYAAVYGALDDLLSLGSTAEEVVLHTDSKLVVEQLSDRWKCNSPHLRAWRDKIWKLLEKFDHPVSFQWVPREENTEADAQSRVLYG
jgi:ribonuclease HI